MIYICCDVTIHGIHADNKTWCQRILRLLPQLLGFVVSCITVYTYLEEEDACKYLVHASTYSRPFGQHSTLPMSCKGVDGSGTYRPVATRDSWCIPTYVSYHDSLEWSVSYGSDQHHHQHNHHSHNMPSLSASTSSVGAGSGSNHGRHSPSPGADSNTGSGHSSTQPYLRLSTNYSDQTQLVGLWKCQHVARLRCFTNRCVGEIVLLLFVVSLFANRIRAELMLVFEFTFIYRSNLKTMSSAVSSAFSYIYIFIFFCSWSFSVLYIFLYLPNVFTSAFCFVKFFIKHISGKN